MRSEGSRRLNGSTNNGSSAGPGVLLGRHRRGGGVKPDR